MADKEGLFRKVSGVVGGGNCVFSGGGVAEFAVSGVSPVIVASPGSGREVCELLALANHEGARIVPCGAGTKLSAGNAPDSLDMVIRLTRLNDVVEYDHENLSVTVGAGLGLAALGEVLAERGQRLPLDPFFAQSSTVGGTVASNSSGPLRGRYGGVRDLVLGMRGALPTGEAVRFGGKVMKNVAGYDMTKLFIGAFGTLGVITEVTFKLFPLSEAEGTVVVGFDSREEASGALDSLAGSFLEPAAVELLNAAAMEAAALDVPLGKHAYYVALGAEGFEAVVGRHFREFTALAGGSGTRELRDERHRGLWRGVSSIPETLGDPVRLKCVVPPSECAAALEALETVLSPIDPGSALLAHALSGVVYCMVRRDGLEAGDFADMVTGARGVAQSRGGSLVVESAPPGLKAAVDCWGDERPGAGLMQAINDAFDPKRVLTPERFVGT